MSSSKKTVITNREKRATFLSFLPFSHYPFQLVKREREREELVMGGSLKGHSGNSRGKQYGLMLFLAFGAAIFGVMVLHKLREKRIFNLLVKEKDRQLFSLQLLLQRERDYNKEAKRKAEEMKAKIYSLRTQKAEGDGRILEMQSLISSLKDEQRTIESALEEKQNEIKLLREKETETNKEGHPQVIALSETLREKEAEIEDLKHRLEKPIKVWSVNADDPSNAAVNLTKTEPTTWRDRIEATGMNAESGGLHESTKYEDLEKTSRRGDESQNETTYRKEDGSMRSGGGRKDTVGFTETRETTGEHSQKLENSRDEVLGDESTDEDQGKKIKDSQDWKGLGIGEENRNTNATEAIVNYGNVLNTKTKEEYRDNEARGDNLNSQGDEGQQLGLNSRGGMKLEMPNNSQAGVGNGVRGRHDNTGNPKGKRWRTLARNRMHDSSMNAGNDDASIQSRRFPKDELQSERYKRLRDDELQKLDTRRGNHDMDLKMKDESSQGNDKQEVYGNSQQGESLEMKNNDRDALPGGEEGKDRWTDVGKAVFSADDSSMKPRNSEDVENERGQGRNTDMNQQIDKGEEVDVMHRKFENPSLTLDDMKMNKTADSEANELAGDASKKKSDELEQSEEHSSGVQQIEIGDVNKVDQKSGEVKIADKSNETEDLEAEDTQEAEDTNFRESKLEDDKEESEDETDEPEF